MRGSISSRSILATVAVVTPARSASCACVSARRVLCLFSLEDRLSRPEGEQLHPREHERLQELLVRSDAFGTAAWLIREYAAGIKPPGADASNEVAAVKAAAEEASEQFRRYRDEVGIRD
jgi:hypothetical protein